MASAVGNDAETMSARYVKFSHGCLIMDCVEDELRKVAKVSDLLSFYGLYRQAMCGDNDRPQPSYLYAEQRLKWNAWTKYKGMNKQKALSKWEVLYNRFLTSFPDVFKGYDADLTLYDPFKFQKDRIHHLESELTSLRLQMPSPKRNGKGSGTGTAANGIQYVTVQRDQYQTIIDQVNQFKNKMQKYHQQFQHNAKQIQSLKKENDALKVAVQKRSGSKTKGFSVMMCLMVIAAVLYLYKRRMRKNRV